MFRGRRNLVVLALGSILGWMLCGAIAASAQAGLSISLLGLTIKLSPDLAAAPAGTTVPVIVRYAQAPAQSETNSILNLGGTLGYVLSSINAQAAVVPVDSLATLASDPNVLYISLDRPVYARQFPLTSAEYTTQPINAPAVWAKGYDGTGIGVAVVDSGINLVDDLSTKPQGLLGSLLSTVSSALSGAQGRIVYSASFLPGISSTTDQYGHGTHVAGLIAGNGTDSTGSRYYRTFYGAAPNANVINLRALDSDGAGTDASVIYAIQAAIQLKSTYNIRVLNLSLGRPIWESYQLDPLCQAVEQAWKAGIVVVVAAGNDGRDLSLNPEGYGTIEAPGNDPYVITVGAMRTMGTATITDDLIASYSSKGPTFIDQIVKPDLVAPGNLVVSLKFSSDSLAVNNPEFVTLNSFYINGGNSQPSAQYFPLSGSSMATGVTSGAVALLLQAHPQLTPDQVKALLMVSANHRYFPASSSVIANGINYTANYDVFTVGAGYLDINAALAAAATDPVPAGSAMSPQAEFDPSTQNTFMVTSQTALWGSTALWGAENVYGSTQFLAGSTALWGADDPQGFTALWGSTALWGAGSTNAATALWGADDVSGSTALWGASSADQSDPSTGGTVDWNASPYSE